VNLIDRLREFVVRRSAPPLAPEAYEEFIRNVELRHAAQARDLARLRALRAEEHLIRHDEDATP
jgi:hypothetical protein